jgi:hypothetical protein
MEGWETTLQAVAGSPIPGVVAVQAVQTALGRQEVMGAVFRDLTAAEAEGEEDLSEVTGAERLHGETAATFILGPAAVMVQIRGTLLLVQQALQEAEVEVMMVLDVTAARAQSGTPRMAQAVVAAAAGVRAAMAASTAAAREGWKIVLPRPLARKEL